MPSNICFVIYFSFFKCFLGYFDLKSMNTCSVVAYRTFFYYFFYTQHFFCCAEKKKKHENEWSIRFCLQLFDIFTVVLSVESTLGMGLNRLFGVERIVDKSCFEAFKAKTECTGRC